MCTKATILLIIEDEYSTRQLWKMLLEEEGYTVEESRDGIDGYKMLQKTSPGLLILDLCMEPRGMDEGKNFLDKKSKDIILKGIPVIIVSGAYSNEVLSKYKVCFPDVKEVLQKPIEDDDLLQVVQKYYGECKISCVNG